MPEHFSKWKLNKAEQKSVEEEEKRVYAERKTAGDSDEDAQKAASEAAATKSKERQTMMFFEALSFSRANPSENAVLPFVRL